MEEFGRDFPAARREIEIMSEQACAAASGDLHYFHQLVARAQAKPAIPTAVVWPHSDVALEGAVEAAKAGVIEPILIGIKSVIEELALKSNLEIKGYRIVEAPSEPKAAEQGALLCRNGEAFALMKGAVHTDNLMRAAMNKETGIRTNRRISHVFVLDTPAYERTVMVTDAAINIAPELEDKFHIIQNAIDLAIALGVQTPRVALLSCLETVNPKIPSTVDAAILCKMAERGQIKGGILDGPLSFDLAISRKSAEIKKVHSPVTAQADILFVPEIVAGNILAKEMEYLAGASLAGIVLGAKVPVILTSRADSAKNRLVSCAIASLLHYASKK